MISLPLKTKRLRLRTFLDSDLDCFYGYRSDTEVARYQGWLPLSWNEASEFLSEHSHQGFGKSDSTFRIAIALRESDVLIGDLGICPIASDEVELSFSLARTAQGRGYATEAVQSVLRALFRKASIEWVRATTDTRNAKSIALLERLEFRRLRTGVELIHCQWCQQHHYALRSRDWATQS